ncbi:MAG: Tpl protein [Candidatus Cloacimonetes bacterium]|nr:Tpl protein [Candidatus Cloacimonadota bacterium]
MQQIVEIMFRTERMEYFVNSKHIALEPDVHVIVRVERGEDIGRVINSSVHSQELEQKNLKHELGKILRIATDEDLHQLEVVEQREKEAEARFVELEKKYSFDMKILDTVYQLDGNKLTFFFSADGRVDFRDFVRQLATEFKTRIELHQTSGREDARRLGGLGICGKSYCCVAWMKKFDQVTIKMAKDQNLLSNLSKISGPCGRLLCCLRFEEDEYTDKRHEFPRRGEKIKYHEQDMMVTKNDFYNGRIYLSAENGENEVITLEMFKILQGKKCCKKNCKK